MFELIGKRAQGWVAEIDPFTNVYGVARSLLAGALLVTQLANPTGLLFRPAAGFDDVPACSGIRAAGAYCVANPHLDLVRLLSIVVLALVVSGYRPRLTGILHAYVAFSFQANALVIEGGDQIHSILALLLVPVTLMDDRRWHWLARPRVVGPLSSAEEARRLVARVCFLLIRLQVAGIYFHAGVAKFAVPEWADGTVLYYWLNHSAFGAPEWLAPFLRPALLNGTLVALLTWGVLVVEYALAAGMLANRKYWPVLLALGVGLHAGIAVLHGLVSFAIIMGAALVLYLRPLDQTFSLPRRLVGMIQAWRSHAATAPRAEPTRIHAIG